MNNLNNKIISEKLINKGFFKILTYNALESTNKTAKELGSNGEKEGTVVVAAHQTNGRGRMGRSFYSPQGSGVYFSVLLRPRIDAENTVLITTGAAVAVCKAIEALSKNKAKIKWVNDVFVSDKKVSGILTEAVTSSSGEKFDYVVLGIGVNLAAPKSGYPDDIKNIAGCIFKEETENFRENFVASFLNFFYPVYKSLEEKSFLNEYKERLLVLNRQITYQKGGRQVTAKVKDIDGLCRLVTETYNGEIDVISSGEITLGSRNFTK